VSAGSSCFFLKKCYWHGSEAAKRTLDPDIEATAASASEVLKLSIHLCHEPFIQCNSATFRKLSAVVQNQKEANQNTNRTCHETELNKGPQFEFFLWFSFLFIAGVKCEFSF
jgi:hypothetical protein